MTADIEARVKTGNVVRSTNTEVFNLTGHDAKRDQRLLGLVDGGGKVRERIRELLTFNSFPDSEDLKHRGQELANMALLSGCEKALIGGPSFFIPIVETYLCCAGIEPVYAFIFRGKDKRWHFGGFVNSLVWEVFKNCRTF